MTDGPIRIRNATLYVGDVLSVLRTLPNESVHCCVTSPPYWGLRSYGTRPQIWGGREDCEHEWNEQIIPDLTGGTKSISGNGKSTPHAKDRKCGACGACGAWRGELGSEPTIDLFVEHLVAVFREVRRVLRSDGTAWCNLGDGYASAPAGNKTFKHGAIFDGRDMSGHQAGRNKSTIVDGLKPKDLCLIPWRFAIAAQADGWYVRDAIVWHKPAPMPESVRDRCTKSWEPIFMLAKSERYYFDGLAVAEPVDRPEESQRRTPARFGGAEKFEGAKIHSRLHSGNEYLGTPTGTRNLRNVWKLSPEAEPAAHFACFPSSLPERCIKAGTSEKGCCAECGKPWVRVTERTRRPTRPGEKTKVEGTDSRFHVSRDPSHPTEANGKVRADGLTVGNRDTRRHVTETVSIGWKPSCTCNAAIVPCTVLEPFCGSGTTLKVAEQLGRRSIGIELNPTYAHEIAVPKIKLALTDRTVKQPKSLAGQGALFE